MCILCPNQIYTYYLRGKYSMKLLSTVAVIFGLLSSIRSGQAAMLANPYGDKPFDINTIKPVGSEDQCDHIQGVTITTTNPAGKIVDERYERHCLRSMDTPNAKNYDKAVNDAAQALKNNKMKLFESIVNTWPNSQRKELRNAALKRSKANINFESPEESYTTPVDGSFESAEMRYYSRPYFMNVLGEKPQKKQTPQIKRRNK